MIDRYWSQLSVAELIAKARQWSSVSDRAKASDELKLRGYERVNDSWIKDVEELF